MRAFDRKGATYENYWPYKGRLRDRHGINVTVPDEAGRTIVHDTIYNELCQGIIQPGSRQRYLGVIAQAVEDGADGVIFGCTEVGLLVSQSDLDVPAFDTTGNSDIEVSALGLGCMGMSEFRNEHCSERTRYIL